MIAHATAFVTQVVGNWLEREITQWVHHVLFTGVYRKDILTIYSFPFKYILMLPTFYSIFVVDKYCKSVHDVEV